MKVQLRASGPEPPTLENLDKSHPESLNILHAKPMTLTYVSPAVPFVLGCDQWMSVHWLDRSVHQLIFLDIHKMARLSLRHRHVVHWKLLLLCAALFSATAGLCSTLYDYEATDSIIRFLLFAFAY